MSWFGFGRRARQRRDHWAEGFRPEWRALLRRRMGHWRHLDAAEQARLEEVALGLLVGRDWEAAAGFALDDEMQVVIAAHAALLVLALPDDLYDHVGSIIVHPSTVWLEGEHHVGHGIMSDEPEALAGEAHYRGPVLLAWDEVDDAARHPGHGHNVVFHEFAHQLDMADGTVDGTPPMAPGPERDRWIEVCSRTFEQVRAGRAGRSIDPYAGQDPGEFFAVATEAFFDASTALRAEHPDLYGVLSGYYGQDPASRLTRGSGGAGGAGGPGGAGPAGR